MPEYAIVLEASQSIHWNNAVCCSHNCIQTSCVTQVPFLKLTYSHFSTNAAEVWYVAFSRQFCDRHHLWDQCKSIKTVRQLTIDAARRGTGNPQLAGGWPHCPPGLALRSRCHILLATPISIFFHHLMISKKIIWVGGALGGQNFKLA